MRWLILALACLATMSCKTVSQLKAQSPDQNNTTELVNSYDGAADSQDSLPDCTPELAGSLFWVRSDKAGYDCSTAGEWVVRTNATQPDTEAEGENGFGPRSVHGP